MSLYVIVATNDTDPVPQFYAIDHASGGYPYWTKWQGSAQVFDSIEKAEEVLTHSDFTKPSEMSDGTIFPPTMVHSGAGISITKPAGALNVYIGEFSVIQRTATVRFEGKIDTQTKMQKLAAIEAAMENAGLTLEDIQLLNANR